MMLKYTVLLIFATIAATVLVVAGVVKNGDNAVHAQESPPWIIKAVNGANPGEVVVSWDPVAGASSYRVGWLAVPDYQANIASEKWRERFAYSDVDANSSYTVTRLTPGIAYYFITGRKQDHDIAWSEWSTLTLNSGALPCLSQPAVAPDTTSALRVANGSNAGEVDVSWDAVPGATGYRVGWLAVPDFEANCDGNRWRERFAYSDISPASSFTATRLTPGIAYYFILGQKQGDDITWSQWAALALNADTTSCPSVEPTTGAPMQTFPASAMGGDYDHDDGLIEVRNLTQLNAIRFDLDGDALVDIEVRTEYLAAFPGGLDDMRCPADGCTGYELAANLDFDTNGNGQADAGDAYWNDGAGWQPLGLTVNVTPTVIATDYYPFQRTFDGNGYTIANLHINRICYSEVGLFAGNSGTIRNVFLDGIDVSSGDNLGNVGGLVASNHGVIRGSAASGTVSGSGFDSSVGGLVGRNEGAISNSTASVTVSGEDYVGGLVGRNWGDINDSTASGAVSGYDAVGGLVGENSVDMDPDDFDELPSGAISDSRASGTVSGNNDLGGLVGQSEGTISGSKASGTVSGNDYVGGLVGGNGLRGDIIDSTTTGNVSGNDEVGGLAGYNAGMIGLLIGQDERPFGGSTANGVVSGNNYIGGLVGRNGLSGAIIDGIANGDVSGNDEVGGLAGHNGGIIRFSEAESDATGQFYVGGLVGRNEGDIADSFAFGNVVGVRYLDALVGANDGGTITDSIGYGTVAVLQ